MKLDFEVDGRSASFSWDRLTGRTLLTIEGEEHLLQSPRQRSAHVAASQHRTWELSVAGSHIQVEKIRPLFFAPLRGNRFIVTVNGETIVDRTGK